MKPIFISYSSKHRELTRELVAAIEAQFGAGSVWWDHELESRGTYSDQIKAALESARVVVVVWTAGAMVSDYVYAEAIRAREQGKLVNVRPADMRFQDLPEPFNVYHVDDADDHERVLDTIAKVMNGTPIPTRVPLHEIYFRHHGRRLVDPKLSRLTHDPRDVSPIDLLQAKFGLVGYVDSSGIKADLVDWCTEVQRMTAGRLIHGAGGLGKTRLLIEVAADLRQQGWTAGFLDCPDTQETATVQELWQALDQLIANGDDRGLLLVVDYAEGRQDEVRRIAGRLSVPKVGTARRIRLVLLTRSAGDWWTTLHDDNPEVQRVFRGSGSGPDVLAMAQISTGRQRLDLFEASLDAFAPVLTAQGALPRAGKPPEERLRQIETGDGHARPLAVQMEALLWLVSAEPEAEVAGVDELLRRVLGLERRHWEKLLGKLEDERARDLSRAVAQVTIIQGVPSSKGAELLLMADSFYQGERTARVTVDPLVRNLARIYGKPDGSIGQLEPDLIGEHHVATVCDMELIDGCLGWIESEPTEVQGRRRRDLLTVLQRATQPEHGKRANDRVVALIDHLVNTHGKALAADMVAVMVDTPGAMDARIGQQLVAMDDETLGAIEAALPTQSLSLTSLSLRIALARHDLAQQGLDAVKSSEDATNEQLEAALRDLAASLLTLANRAGAAHANNEALECSQKALAVYRTLDEVRPDTYLVQLATILTNLCVALARLDRSEEAVATGWEAMATWNRVTDSRPGEFIPEYAGSLANLSVALSNHDRRKEALAQALELAQHAAAIYRSLVDTRLDAFLPGLARSLCNVGTLLSDLGRDEEALAAKQEAVEILRNLAEARPDAFLVDLATGLESIGDCLSSLGRFETALSVAQDALGIRRHLAEEQPTIFLLDLATGLDRVSVYLSYLGRFQEALAAGSEALDIRRGLAETQPEAVLPDLAKSLSHIGGYLSDLGRFEEAVVANQEALDIRRRLAEAQPDVFLPDLASSLSSVGIDLSNLGRLEEALAAGSEAVDIRRGLAEAQPDVFLSDLASSLRNVGSHLSSLGRFDAALSAGQEAVDIRRQLAEARPDTFLPDLAQSLGAVSQTYAKLLRQEEAERTAHEALQILAPFVKQYPEAST